MSFGQRLRELRKERNVTQQELADGCGVTFTYISKIENGHIWHGPSRKFIQSAAGVLGADSRELLLLAGQFDARWLKTMMKKNRKISEIVLAICNDNLTDDQINRIQEIVRNGT